MPSDIPGFDKAQAKYDAQEPPEKKLYPCDVCGGKGKLPAADTADECIENCPCHEADKYLRDAINALAGQANAPGVEAMKGVRDKLRECRKCKHECAVCGGSGEC